MKITLWDAYEMLREGQITPRYHNGVGFAQVYLTPDVRLHVWHPAFPNEPEAFGNRHDHRFDMESHIIYGALTDIRLFPEPCAGGNFGIYSVRPAHEDQPDIPQRTDKTEYCVGMDAPVLYLPGDSYTMPARQFHESRGHGRTLTVVKKSNQSPEWARILATEQQSPVHGMASHKLPDMALREHMLSIISLAAGKGLAKTDLLGLFQA